MTEADTPTDKPERSVETTLALHGIFSTLSDKMMEIGESFYRGELDTQMTHREIFPESNCQRKMVVTYADNLVQYANLTCREGCKNKVEVHPMEKPDQTSTIEKPEFTVTFEDVAFISGEFSNSEDGKGLIMRPQILQSNPHAEGLRDEDI